MLGRSEDCDLTRLAALAGRIFHTPVAYIAISQPAGQPISRFGAGAEHWEHLEAVPGLQNLVSPTVIQDLPEDCDELSFAAVAPIQTLCRKRLGVFVLADRAARAAFTAGDMENLADLAAIVGDRIEMRMIAAQAVMTKSLYREAIAPNLLRPSSACGGEALQRA